MAFRKGTTEEIIVSQIVCSNLFLQHVTDAKTLINLYIALGDKRVKYVIMKRYSQITFHNKNCEICCHCKKTVVTL